ncbi:uncharacterized protein LOC141534613 [Cotesia typhae]|uniref:uncharacterized protein LOC141534613 n=1 Tax=Cotesia typhae TaxID=2053667 RepID=UPI003D682A30
MKIFFLCFFAALACQVCSLTIVTTSPITDEDIVIRSIDDTLSDLKKLNDSVANSNVSNKLQSSISRVLGSIQQIFDPKNIVYDEVPSTRSVESSPVNSTHQNKSTVIKKTTFADEERKALEHRYTFGNPKNIISQNNYQIQFEPEEEITLSPPVVKNIFDSYSKELYDINHPLVRNYIEGIKKIVPPKKTVKPLPEVTVKFIKPRDPVTELPRNFDIYDYDQVDQTDFADRASIAHRAGIADPVGIPNSSH